MKTTIEIKGYQIVIDETEELVTVTAMKDDETIEEFSLELTEGDDAQDSEDLRSFNDFDEEEDFDGEEDGEEDFDGEEDGEEDEEEESENKLESFQSFINKNK